MSLLHVVLLSALSSCCLADKLLLVHESNETDLADLFESSLPSGVSVTHRLAVDHERDSDETPLCDALSAEGPFSAIVDLSWGGWAAGRRAAAEGGVPYVHVEASNKPFVMVRPTRMSRS